jgi:hypothetical protein
MVDDCRQAGAEIDCSRHVEVTEAMIDAGLEALMSHFPDSASYYDDRAVRAIFLAMYAEVQFSSGKEPQSLSSSREQP